LSTISPVGVDGRLLGVGTSAGVGRVVVGPSKHPPHDGVEPRQEQERQQADMTGGNLLSTLAASEHARTGASEVSAEPRTSALDMTLPAATARARAVTDRYLLPSIDGTDRHTDGQTDGHPTAT